MKKRFYLLFLFFMSLVLVGCSQGARSDKDNSYPGDHQTEGPNYNDEASGIIVDNNTMPNRKIIYTVRAHISTKDANETYKSIKASINSDEWFDFEKFSNTNRIELKIRIKSDRLDEFIESLGSYGEVGNFSKTSEDISLNYQDNLNHIEVLETERGRLLELYSKANYSELTYISERLAQVEFQIRRLRSDLNVFDSLVDYSEVYLSIYQHKLEEKPTFSSSIGKAFVGGWNATVATLKFFVVAISTILPFLIIIVPVGGAIFLVIKRRKK